jgi:PEGA domain
MKISRVLVAAACAVALLGTAPAALAQRGGGVGHGGGGGFHGGGMGGGFRGGGSAGSMMGHGGGFRGMGPGPMIGTRGVGGGPFIRGGGPFIRGGNFGHGFNGHGFVVGPAHFYRPYYSFRPHSSLGFGLWAGYPFAYPYAFYDPFFYYPYDSSYSDDSSFPHYPDGYLSSDESAPTYSTSWSSMVEPDQTNMGGLSFDVTPATAEVFVDNMRVGTVGQFTPTTQPVGLPAGHHHIEIRTPGYQTMSFDVDIVAGEVTPFQGMMQRD